MTHGVLHFIWIDKIFSPCSSPFPLKSIKSPTNARTLYFHQFHDSHAPVCDAHELIHYPSFPFISIHQTHHAQDLQTMCAFYEKKSVFHRASKDWKSYGKIEWSDTHQSFFYVLLSTLFIPIFIATKQSVTHTTVKQSQSSFILFCCLKQIFIEFVQCVNY